MCYTDGIVVAQFVCSYGNMRPTKLDKQAIRSGGVLAQVTSSVMSLNNNSAPLVTASGYVEVISPCNAQKHVPLSSRKHIVVSAELSVTKRTTTPPQHPIFCDTSHAFVIANGVNDNPNSQACYNNNF